MNASASASASASDDTNTEGNVADRSGGGGGASAGANDDLMKDIKVINTADRSVKAELYSKDKTTVGDLLEMIGKGILVDARGTMKASKSAILEKGTYRWTGTRKGKKCFRFESSRAEEDEARKRRPVDSTEEGPDRKRLQSIGAGLLGASAAVVELPLAEQGTPKTVDDLVLRFPVKQEKEHSFVLADLINDEVIERQDSLQEVKNLVCKLLDAAVSPPSQNDKEKFPIGCTVCGSGGGKSTLCSLLEQRWNGEIKETINAHKSVKSGKISQASLVSTALATFNSTCNYDKDEKSRLSPEASLGIRLLASRNHWSHHSVSVFLNTREEADPYAHLGLKECLEKIVPENENEAVIVLVDEILKLDNDNVIHDILLQLSNFQQECLRDSKKLFVVVTSLSSKPPASLTRKTQRPVFPISLPPISAPEVLKQAKQFAEKLVATRADITEDFLHHLISEFCTTGGLVKSMQAVVLFFKDPQNNPNKMALQREFSDQRWVQGALLRSVFGIPVSSSDSLGDKTVEDLISAHRVAVVKVVLGPSRCLRMKIRIPVYLLRSIGVIGDTGCTLTQFQQQHVSCIMNTLANNRQNDGSYAKPFEIALMRVLCLRLSLIGGAVPLEYILPGCGCYDVNLLQKTVEKADCQWVEVQKLTKKEVKKRRKHGTMVYSKLTNEGAVEGFWYLIVEGKKFVLFLQMKFWGYCAPKKIATWETKIHDRAQEVFGLSKGDYVPLFCSTSKTFKVTSSLALANRATEHLLEPFGICPMMLYNEERSKASQS